VRIFLNGIGAFGADVFAKLQEDGQEIVAVASPRQSLSGRPDRLWAAAEAAGVSAYETSRLGEPEIEAALRANRPELGVMAFVQDLISQTILELPASGTIQYHPSLLPKHRGRSSINWAIIKGEPFTGVSIFWPDQGLDTGPVLLQKQVDIGPDDTAGSLYYDKLYPLGIEALVESVGLVAASKAPKLVQDESQMTYERPAEGRAARIDWRLPLADVYNLIRGCEPSPAAWTRWEERELRVTNARPIVEFPDATPGVVAAIDDAGVVVGAGAGAVLIRGLQAGSERAGPAHEVAAQLGMTVGTRFLNPRAV
jgi:methionyl-tRNA formyltransferase